ncbi:hypothetical protein PV646_24645 [Streptomyces sp. ID05-26A]|nr:hypothetical protein [Streptomyces sp. ID05-26A]
MAEKPDETAGPGETPWPVVSRGMINHNPESTGRFPAPTSSAPHREEQGGTRWSRVLLVVAVLALLIAVVALVAYLVLA